MLKITNSKNSKFQGQQKNLWEQNMCAKLRATLETVFSKIGSFFNEYLEIKAETKKNAQSKQCFPMGLLSHLKILTLKIGTLCIYRVSHL